MWSYGILVWELISDQDITNLQPLAIAQAMQVKPPCSFPVLVLLPSYASTAVLFSDSEDMYRLHIA